MHRIFLNLSKGMAMLGGAVLSVLVAIIVLSIIGRETNSFLHGDFAQANLKGLADWLLGIQLPGLWGRNGIRLGPINGDYEIVEAGVAFAIFAFLPLTQITSGHAVVDIFTSWMPDRTQRVLMAVIEVVFAVVLVLIALQLYEGTLSKYQRHQTTFLLQFPLWWPYAASLVAAVMAALVGIYVAIARSIEVFTHKKIVTEGLGADH